MSQDGPHDAQPSVPTPAPPTQSPSQSHTSWRNAFGVPEPVKRIFRKFPLTTYTANELPITSPGQRNEHSLWIWTTEEGAANGSPSFNPSCLKWQTYLKFANVPFRTVSSNNHASPSGSLPFLLPSTPSSSPADQHTKQPAPISSSKLHSWTLENKSARHPPSSSSSSSSSSSTTAPSAREELYTALLDHPIRLAYLYTLYLDPQNFSSVAKPLYVSPSSTNTFVGAAIAYQLRAAAEVELLKRGPVDAEALMVGAEEAFQSLETLLVQGGGGGGGKEEGWFFGNTRPGLFDAAVFAYTHTLLDEGLGWVEDGDHDGYGAGRMGLRDVVRGCEGLVRHRERILKEYYRS